MTPPSPSEVFTQRAEQYGQQEQIYRQKSGRVGWLRLVIFSTGVGSVFYLFRHDYDLAAWLTLAAFYGVFLIVLRWHQRLQYQQRHHAFLQRINLEEITRLQGNLRAFDTGERYRNAQHLYTADLDIFGDHSLFQLLNRAVTSVGKDQLGDWLKAPATPDQIQDRQGAIAELTPQVEWRQQLQAKALHYQPQVAAPLPFFAWLHAPDFFVRKAWLKVLIFTLPVLTIAALVAWWLNRVSFYLPAAFMFAQYVLNFRYAIFREEYYVQSNGMHEVLKSYTALLAHLETQVFTAPQLVAMRQLLQIQGKTASVYLNRLASIIEYISARLNVYMNLLLNSILMWDYYWMYRLEKWKKTMAVRLEPILHVIAETEALASLAAFQYANPTFAVPELSAEPFEVRAVSLGHPLVFASHRVTNDFSLAGAGQTMVITGSNMSGKSTFLRTVGINLVLALAGSVVNARALRVYPAQVYTAMRTEDNLAESTSSFYAELKRLKMLLDLTATRTPVYYFLDEILKGTNSRDRHLGAQALIRQLHQRPAAGLISTHDLELGQLENENSDYIQNYSFNSSIEGDQIIFDYKLQPGVCNSFNASKLMQQMGIEL